MATLLDDLDPYGAQAHPESGRDRQWRESTPDDAPASPITRLLDLSFLAAVTPRSPERSALIDFSVSPPPPLYPSSRPSAQPDMAPVHLLDNDSFAVNESPIRVSEGENRPLARPARKRWSVMTKLREEQGQIAPRPSSPPVKDLSPFRAAGDASVFLSPSQLGVVDLSLIADEGASFLAVADTSETAALSRLGPRAVQAHAHKEENLSGDSSAGGGGQGGGMSVLLRGFEVDASASTKESETGRDDPAHLAQSSSILPTTLTSSHRRALQHSVAHFDSPPLLLNEPTFSLDDPSSSHGAEVTLLNCSTASFKDYRDSPRKPRLLLSTHTEDWSLEEEEEEEQEERSRPDGDDDGKTPRPPRRRTGRGRVSDATTASFSSSDGDSFRLDRFQTSGFGTGILNQSPPTGALKPESTGTLRLELGLGLGLGGLDAFAFASPPREASVSPPPPVSPVTELATSTRTVTAPSRSSSRASTVVVDAVAEGDLLGIDDALARSASAEAETETETETTTKPPRGPVLVQSSTVTPTPTPAAKANAMSGAERLKRRLEELRAQKQQHRQTVSSSSSAAAAAAAAPTAHASTRTRASTTTPAAAVTIASTLATPAASRRSFARPSLGPSAPPTITTGRLARPRLSALPTSSTTAPPAPPPATPGERKESTAARLERLRSERKERETIRSAGATTTTTTTTPGRAGGGGLVRSASLIAPRDRSLASFSSGGSSDARSGGARLLPSSKSLADLSTIGKQPATASRRTSLLPAPTPASTAGRRPSLGPSSEVPRRRMSLAPESSVAAPPPTRSSRQSLAPTSRHDALDRSLPPSSSSSSSRTSFASIRRSSSLQQISEPAVAGRRGSLAAVAMKPTLSSLGSTQERTPFKSLQTATTSSELAAPGGAPPTIARIGRAPSTRRLSRLARPSMDSLGPR